MIKWEKLEDSIGSGIKTERAKVPGGWLVAVHVYDGGGVTFYPDPTTNGTAVYWTDTRKSGFSWLVFAGTHKRMAEFKTVIRI